MRLILAPGEFLTLSAAIAAGVAAAPFIVVAVSAVLLVAWRAGRAIVARRDELVALFQMLLAMVFTAFMAALVIVAIVEAQHRPVRTDSPNSITLEEAIRPQHPNERVLPECKPIPEGGVSFAELRTGQCWKRRD